MTGPKQVRQFCASLLVSGRIKLEVPCANDPIGDELTHQSGARGECLGECG